MSCCRSRTPSHGGGNAAYERTHRLLAIENLADLSPPKSAYLFFASHPTASERLAAGRAWSSQHVSQ